MSAATCDTPGKLDAIVSEAAVQKRSKKSLENEELAKESAQGVQTRRRAKLRIMKNVVVVGASWILLFTAFQSIANLQSSLNSDSGLGMIKQSEN